MYALYMNFLKVLWIWYIIYEFTSCIFQLVLDSASDTSSDRGSPAFGKLVDIDSTDTASTSTSDSLSHIPYMDSVAADSHSITTVSSVESDSQTTRPVPPPRRNRAAKKQIVTDKLITTPKLPPQQPVVKDRLISQKSRPKPAPRKSLSEDPDNNVKVNTGVNAATVTSDAPIVNKTLDNNPLIRLESYEDDLDPFQSPRFSTALQNAGHITDKSQGLNGALNRTPAFKKDVDMPVRHTMKPDISPEMSPERELGQKKGVTDVLSDFDPLTSKSADVTLRQTSENADRQRPVTELLQNWELKTLTATSQPTQSVWNTSSTSAPPGSNLQSAPYHKPLTRLANASPNQYRPPQVAPAPFQRQNVTPTKSKESTTAEQNRTSGDPFEDILNLSLTSSPSQPTWEKFEWFYSMYFVRFSNFDVPSQCSGALSLWPVCLYLSDWQMPDVAPVCDFCKIYTWTLCLSYHYEKQTSRIQSVIIAAGASVFHKHSFYICSDVELVIFLCSFYSPGSIIGVYCFYPVCCQSSL